jgi:hypothetical protein
MSYGSQADKDYRGLERDFIEMIVEKFKHLDEEYLTTVTRLLANILIVRGRYGRMAVWGQEQQPKIVTGFYLPVDGKTEVLWTEIVTKVREFAADGDPQISWILGKIAERLMPSIESSADGPRRDQAHNRT